MRTPPWRHLDQPHRMRSPYVFGPLGWSASCPRRGPAWTRGVQAGNWSWLVWRWSDAGSARSAAMGEALMEAATEAATEAAAELPAAEAAAVEARAVAPVVTHEGAMAAVPAPVGTEPGRSREGRHPPVSRHPGIAAVVGRHPDVSRSGGRYAKANTHRHAGEAGERRRDEEQQGENQSGLEESAFTSDPESLPPVSSYGRPGHRFWPRCHALDSLRLIGLVPRARMIGGRLGEGKRQGGYQLACPLLTL